MEPDLDGIHVVDVFMRDPGLFLKWVYWLDSCCVSMQLIYYGIGKAHI